MAASDDNPGGEPAAGSGKVLALFDDPDAARAALEALLQADFQVDLIELNINDRSLKGFNARGGAEQGGEAFDLQQFFQPGASVVTVQAGDRTHDAMRLMAALPGRPTKVLKY